MIVNERGHIEMANGASTESRVIDCPAYYVGTPTEQRITFASMVLSDGRVVVHSALHLPERETEDFLYEVVERHEAVDAARSMVEDAYDYLRDFNYPVDGNLSGSVFVNKLEAELKNSLH